MKKFWSLLFGFSPLLFTSNAFALMAKPDALASQVPLDSWWAAALEYSWPLMSLALGLVDGFNPCAMWTLFILIGFLLTLEDSRKRWLIGGVFIASSGIIYLAALFTYLIGFQALTGFIATSAMSWVFMAIGVMSIGAGMMAVYNYKNKGIECDVRDASSKKKFHQQLTDILARENIYFILGGMVLLAFSVNAFELLCSFAIPTIFTSTLIAMELSWPEKIAALLLYDFAYILDDLIVFTIAIKTLSLKVFSPKVTQWANLIGGILLIIIGMALLVDPAYFMNLAL